MKKRMKQILALCFVAVMLFTCSLTVNAEGNELTINSDAKVQVGDTVKYSLYLSDTTEEIIGFELRLFFDSEYLEFDKESLSYEKFDGVIHNVNLENKIPISWTNISSPVDFSSKGLFLSAEFKVLKAGDTEISHFVTEMYGDDMTYLKSYKWTYDITVNNEPIVTDKAPVINADEETLQNNQGGFINYEDGMGEENSPNKDNHEYYGATKVVTSYQEVTRYENMASDSNGSGNMTTIIIFAAVIIIIGAIVAILIVKRNDDKKTANYDINSDN